MWLHSHNRYWTFTTLSQHCHITIKLEPICVTTFHLQSQNTTDSDYVFCKEMIALCTVLDNLHWWILVIVLCNAMSQKSVSTQGQSSLPVWSVSCVRTGCVCILCEDWMWPWIPLPQHSNDYYSCYTLHSQNTKLCLAVLCFNTFSQCYNSEMLV